MNRYFSTIVFLFILSAPFLANAHEVYVLTPAEIDVAVATPSPNPFSAMIEEWFRFLPWAIGLVIAFLLVGIIFRKFDWFFDKLKPYAPLIGRIGFGVSVFSAGFYSDFFGPELPAAEVLPHAVADTLGILLMAVGIAIMLGLFTRFAALFMLAVYIFAISKYGFYMLTYINYLGTICLFLILGGGMLSLDKRISFLRKLDEAFSRISTFLREYSFLILRILFGTAIFFASFYSKFLHSNMALETVRQYSLTDYFPFSPMFLVLGAFLVEAAIGICIALGFQIRVVTVVFVFFLTQSLIFFGEAVWPHLILFGINATLFAHGYDKFTLESRLFKKAKPA